MRMTPFWFEMVLTFSIIHDSSGKNEKSIFLKNSRGVMSIQQPLKDLLVGNAVGEYSLVARMGRLNCSTGPFSLKVSVMLSRTIPGSNVIDAFTEN
jgi:hypothetical protein